MVKVGLRLCLCICGFACVYVCVMCISVSACVCMCVYACVRVLGDGGEWGFLGVPNATLETVGKRTVQMQLQQKHKGPGARKSSAAKTSAEVNLIKTHRHTHTHGTTPSKHPIVDRGPNAVAFNKHFSLTARIKCDRGHAVDVF